MERQTAVPRSIIHATGVSLKNHWKLNYALSQTSFIGMSGNVNDVKYKAAAVWLFRNDCTQPSQTAGTVFHLKSPKEETSYPGAKCVEQQY